LKKKIYTYFLVITIIWTLAIFLIPFFQGLGDNLFSEYGYIFFSTTCHQLDSRSFFFFGQKVAVCSRCTSVYIAFTFGVLIYPLFNNKENKLPPIWLLIIASGLLLLDAGFDILDIFKNTFLSRIITGSIIGFLLPFYLIPGTINFVNEINQKYFKGTLGKKENK